MASFGPCERLGWVASHEDMILPAGLSHSPSPVRIPVSRVQGEPSRSRVRAVCEDWNLGITISKLMVDWSVGAHRSRVVLISFFSASLQDYQSIRLSHGNFAVSEGLPLFRSARSDLGTIPVPPALWQGFSHREEAVLTQVTTGEPGDVALS